MEFALWLCGSVVGFDAETFGGLARYDWRGAIRKSMVLNPQRLAVQFQVGPEVIHHGAELVEVERLGAVAEGFLGFGMDLHQQAVGANGDPGNRRPFGIHGWLRCFKKSGMSRLP